MLSLRRRRALLFSRPAADREKIRANVGWPSGDRSVLLPFDRQKVPFIHAHLRSGQSVGRA